MKKCHFSNAHLITSQQQFPLTSQKIDLIELDQLQNGLRRILMPYLISADKTNISSETLIKAANIYSPVNIDSVAAYNFGDCNFSYIGFTVSGFQHYFEIRKMINFIDKLDIEFPPYSNGIFIVKIKTFAKILP